MNNNQYFSLPNFPARFAKNKTPFYFYDTALLNATLTEVKSQSKKYGFRVHYALKANPNPEILSIVNRHGLGADCVSGGEVKAAIKAGFNASKIVFAGVGKSDEEIKLALKANIFCFNCESLQEIEVINKWADKFKTTAQIALRINPNIDAHTHHYITTGLEENKFGISQSELERVIVLLPKLKNIKLSGLHFHIGSQITDLKPFKQLCKKVNELQIEFNKKGIHFQHINLGGGLGVNYKKPDSYPIVDFASYFNMFHQNLKLQKGQEVHFELGRSIIANCGSLITKVLYIKEGNNVRFAVLDAGMTELIRPALYESFHKIEKLESQNSNSKNAFYDVVGPICESSDCFAKEVEFPELKRGDLIAIRSTGAYGEAMASNYNLRKKPKSLFS